jgi:hypothetical protein
VVARNTLVAVAPDGANIFRIVSHRHFELFCNMIDSLPPKAVLKAAARERLMLDEDLAFGRLVSNKDTALILNFCRFIEGAALHGLVLPRTMPMEHWTFYRRTVERLVAVGELPRQVQEDFEAANHDVFFRIVA